MRQPPPISQFRHYPSTAATAALAIIVTALAHWQQSFGALDMSYWAFHGQPWRLVTSALPHVGILHLVFNLYWIWVFGTLIEEHFGWWRTVAMYILLAAGSAAAEYAVMSGGVGLSGVGYGLFGMLWVLERRDPRFRGVVDANTILTFVVWFFFCIFMTVRNIMPIGNVAHGSGTVLGALIGWAISSRATLRSAAVAILLLVLAATFWAATAGRPLVNLSKEGERDLSSLGYAALERGDNSAAIRYLKQAAKYRYVSANTWYNLGVALSRSGDLAAAYTAFARAAQLEPGSTQYKTAASEMKEFLEGGGVTPHEP